jgi:hypothetical protein
MSDNPNPEPHAYDCACDQCVENEPGEFPPWAGACCVAANREQAKDMVQALVDAGLPVGTGLVLRRGRSIWLAGELSDDYHAIMDRVHKRPLQREARRRREQRERELEASSGYRRYRPADWLKCKAAWRHECAYCGVEILARAAGSPGKHFDLCWFRRQGPSRGGDVDRITLTPQTD